MWENGLYVCCSCRKCRKCCQTCIPVQIIRPTEILWGKLDTKIGNFPSLLCVMRRLWHTKWSNYCTLNDLYVKAQFENSPEVKDAMRWLVSHQTLSPITVIVLRSVELEACQGLFYFHFQSRGLVSDSCMNNDFKVFSKQDWFNLRGSSCFRRKTT